MNEFVAKKIGEVMAFSRVGRELLDKGVALESVFGAELLDRLKGQLDDQHRALEKEAQAQTSIATAKAEATSQKLWSMAETYVGDEWDNPVEIMEWLGFFEGAAVVHCSLVEGAAGQLNLDSLLNTVTAAKELHHQILHTVLEAIKRAGAEKA